MAEAFSATAACLTALILIVIYLAYKGPNSLYKRELEIVSSTLKKTVRETVRHDRGNIEAWLLIVDLVKIIPTSSADFTISYLIVKLENKLLYKMEKNDVEEYKRVLSRTLCLKRELKSSLEIDISRNRTLARIAIPKRLIIKSIKTALKESS